VSVSRVKLQSQQTVHNGMWHGVKRFDNYTIQARKKYTSHFACALTRKHCCYDPIYRENALSNTDML
jgi:hypothetical protein